jgi:two-component system, response regulator PdtaR
MGTGRNVRLHRSHPRKSMSAGTSVSQDESKRPLRVLIVEDDSMVSLFLQGVLQELGHSVSGIAPSLRTALAVAAGTPTDLAIVDVGLVGDGGDGIDAAIALRKRHSIPALLMTGASFTALGERVNDAEPLGLLLKPYTEGDVEKALTEALAKLPEATPARRN